MAPARPRGSQPAPGLAALQAAHKKAWHLALIMSHGVVMEIPPAAFLYQFGENYDRNHTSAEERIISRNYVTHHRYGKTFNAGLEPPNGCFLRDCVCKMNPHPKLTEYWWVLLL
ncbi:uncharacterized protein LOC143689673 [Tamandua tetradactyla]|uniref:uncharacterized protein LOC143689673 n=1 Tax=Tamandua tetradactyla TaxID=48850 RepID=UPI0040543A31